MVARQNAVSSVTVAYHYQSDKGRKTMEIYDLQLTFFNGTILWIVLFTVDCKRNSVARQNAVLSVTVAYHYQSYRTIRTVYFL